MNRLQLAQRLRQEAGIAGTGPTTTVSQTGEMKRVVDWIDGAWNEIQKRHLWDFLWESATVTIIATTNATTGTIPAVRYVKDATYQSSTPIEYVPWAEFRLRYPSALIVEGIPSAWSIRPDKAFVVNAKPTADTAYSVERYMNPVVMDEDADTPALPAEHHMAIVYKALLLYANFEEAGVTRATAQAEYERILGEMGFSELPDMQFGEPLC